MTPAPREPSYADVQRLALSALAEGRWSEAEEHLAMLENVLLAEDLCSGDERWIAKLPDGGKMVAGPRAVLTLGPNGAVTKTETVDGCLRYADATLRVVETRTSVRLDGAMGKAELAVEEEEAMRGPFFDVSGAWVVARYGGGEYVALRRRDGRVFRGHPRVGSYDDERFRGIAAAGSWLVVETEKATTLTGPEDRPVAVRGCRGRLLAADLIGPDEIALHVEPPPKREDEPSTDTSLCLVRADGRTRRVIPLGSATCGLAAPRPCSWVLDEISVHAVVFGSMRGQVKRIDPRTGASLPDPPPAARTERIPRVAPEYCVRAGIPVPTNLCPRVEDEP